MLLTKVDIKNFRSLETLSLDFGQYRAIGLVGVNESGKSNVLKALSLISSDAEIRAGDVRVPRSSEPEIEDATVTFSLALTEEELSEVINGMKADLLISRSGKMPQFMVHDDTRTFEEFAASRREVRFVVDLLAQDVDVHLDDLGDEFDILLGHWRYSKSPVAGTAVASLTLPWDSSTVSLLKPALIDADDFESPLSLPNSIEATSTLIDALWTYRLKAYVRENLPEGLLWSYDKENLLPSSVPLAAFCADPTTCRPLQSIFEIAKVENIAETVERTKKAGRPHLDNLLNRIAARASEHIQNVWRDYKAASIALRLDGEDISISVRDEALSFAFADRSDGFKRFVTFLLLISAKVKNKSLENVIILIDEPEISLHPAGIRNLRDELLRISENNLVVFATHSPHMIDRRCIGRHILVKKINEATLCEQAGNGRVFDEEVLLNALGVSIFESIKQKNLLFEGWRDKRLFEVFRDAHRKDAIYGPLQDVGAAFVTGVKDVPNIVPLLALANTIVHVVSDHDSPALEARKSFREARFDAEWSTYRDLGGAESEALTAEDFIKPITLKNAFDAICARHGLAATLVEKELDGWSRMAVIEGKLRGVAPQRAKELGNEVKSEVFDALKSSQVDERYVAVARRLAEVLA